MPAIAEPVTPAAQPGSELTQATPTPQATPPSASYGPTETQKKIEGGLVSALSQDNEVLALARKEGDRSSYAKGLGPSSYSARASQGEAMKYAAPLVTAAVKHESNLEEAALDREQQTGLLASQLDAETAAQERQITAASESQATEIAFKEAAQRLDIDYKEWLEGITFEHERLLSADRQASDAYTAYLEGVTEIFGNPDTTTAQKTAASNALRSGTIENLELLEITTGIDLSTFLPVAESNDPQPPWMGNAIWGLR